MSIATVDGHGHSGPFRHAVRGAIILQRCFQGVFTLLRAFRTLSFVAAGLLVCFVHPIPVGAEPVVEGGAARKLNRYLERAEVFGFAGVVASSRNGKVELLKGYGLARRDEGVAFTEDTAFNIGSLAKQFTATAVLLLQSDGKLHTKDTIGKHLNGVPQDKQRITVHQLLTHTSGLTRDVPRQLDSRAAVVEAILAKPLRHAPGERFAYSNAGYRLLAALVEVTSGESFDVFVRRELFDKAGLTDTGFYEDSAWQDRPQARSYFETSNYADLATFERTWGGFGSGSIVSTAADLLHWEAQLRAGNILKPAALELLFQPHVEIDKEESYAYGWYVMRDKQRNAIIYHGGDDSGYSIDFRRVEQHDAVMLIATNQGYVDGLGLKRAFQAQVQRLLTYGSEPMPPQAKRADASELAPLEGTWSLGDGEDIIIRQERGVLLLEPRSQQAFSLLHEPDARQAPDYAQHNEVAMQVMEATTAGSVPADQAEALAPFAFAMQGGWGSLTDEFGAVRGMKVLGTAPYPFSRTWIRTFTELQCDRGPILLTYGYQRDTFFDFTTWENTAPPSTVVAARVGQGTFQTWSLWKKVGTTLLVSIDDAGGQQLTIQSRRGDFVATRIGK